MKLTTNIDAEEKRKLYCKMSALKARVKRRREQMWQRNTQTYFCNQFEKLTSIISDCLDCSCRDQVLKGILGGVKKRKAQCLDKIQCKATTKITKKDFKEGLAKFIKKEESKT